MKKTITVNTNLINGFGIELALMFSLFLEYGAEKKHPQDKEICFELQINKKELFDTLSFMSQARIENIIECLYRLRFIEYGDTEEVFNIKINPKFYKTCKQLELL